MAESIGTVKLQWHAFTQLYNTSRTAEYSVFELNPIRVNIVVSTSSHKISYPEKPDRRPDLDLVGS